MEQRRRAALESRAELSKSSLLRPLASKIPRLVGGLEDGGCCSTVKVRVVVCSLMQDTKHSVNIIVSSMKVGALDSVHQIVHLVLRDCLDSGECPLSTQCNTKGAHRIEGLHCSATRLQV